MNEMKKVLLTFLILGVFVFAINSVTAGDYIIRSGGNDIFTVDTSGNANATGWLAEDGIQLTDIYVSIVDVATCDVGEFLTFDGTDWSCESPSLNIEHGSVTIDGANITTGTISIERLPDLTNATTLAYQNITGIPTCDAGDFLAYDGTDLSCSTPTSSMDYTNIAMTNQTNTFTPQQVFSAGMNVTGYIELQSDVSGVKRGGTSFVIDDSNNFVITLG
jgi:hypothetical protein